MIYFLRIKIFIPTDLPDQLFVSHSPLIDSSQLFKALSVTFMLIKVI